MLRPLPLLVACAVALLVVSGCDSDRPDPNYSSVTPTPSASTPSPTPTASGSPTDIPATGPNSSPGEVAPTEPVAASADTTTGALSFAAYYLKSLDWAFATETAGFLEPFYAASCKACQSRLEYLDGLFSGQHLEGGRIMIKEQEIVKNDGRLGAVMAVSTVVAVGAGRVLTSTGATASSDPGIDPITLTTWLVRDGDRWRIVDEAYA